LGEDEFEYGNINKNTLAYKYFEAGLYVESLDKYMNDKNLLLAEVLSV